MEIKPLIDPVDRDILEKELCDSKLLRKTNNADNHIYVLTAQDSPNVMNEIGRLRELSFRDGGGGTGASTDIDESDTQPDGYQQLIVWDPKEREIVGGYRFIVSRTTHPKWLSTEHYYEFSDKFREKYLKHTIELGRSFVQPKYQVRNNRKSIYALDNLWDGLGALILGNPDIKYFFGKVTMYGDYNKEARNVLIYFLKRYFPDNENLVRPLYPIEMEIDNSEMEQLFTGGSYAEDYKILMKKVRTFNENIPPLINAYMNLSPSMKVFPTVKNMDFGGVEETGILVTIGDIYSNKAERHFK